MENLIDLVADPLRYGFMVRALVVSVLVGGMCAVLGCYVVMRGLAFMGDAIAHGIFPGVVVAFVMGLSPFAGAVATGVGVAFLIGYVSRRTGLSEDTSIGILFASLFALGVALLALARGLPVKLDDLLLGQVLGVSQMDMIVTAGLAAVVLLVLYAAHKELVFTSFDPLGAQVIGLPVALLTYMLLVLLALVVVIALQAVGIILVMAMLVIPAATAYLLVKTFAPMMALGAFLGATTAVVGLYLSFYLNIPSGASMVLVSAAVFMVVAAVRRPVFR